MHRLAISPCPNDTFAFYALLHGKTSWRAPFDLQYLDIEELNHLCMSGAVDFCKISFHAYVLLRDRFRLLRSGSALGFGCGPLVVCKENHSRQSLIGKRIAIPGRYTTAALLLKLWLGEETELVEMVFDRIMPAVADGAVDAGLIIHESRFTYAQHGLSSAVDLGDWWEKETGFPIPLGGIVARKDLPESEIVAFENALSDSIAYAFDHREETVPYMREHAQEMARDVMDAHVDLYVNDFTRDLGQKGNAAIKHLVERVEALGNV